jgi:hypothetical protein
MPSQTVNNQIKYDNLTYRAINSRGVIDKLIEIKEPNLQLNIYKQPHLEHIYKTKKV